jgi:superfamily II DNA or RNA helicase/phage baseplate assembly protein W
MDSVDVGTEVQDIRNRSRKGVVISGIEVFTGRSMVKVRWSDNSIARIPLSRLETMTEARDVWSLLRAKSFGGIDDFTRNFTHRKLLNPVDDTLYTLLASRTKLLPHQFKPLVKFLDSIHRRYLIADEVGLGKTIEAGIILSELRARGLLGSLMIFCPNHLRQKWESELLHRFDQKCTIVGSRSEWNAIMDEIQERGRQDLNLIVGHKTLAARPILDRLAMGAPAFDLLIVDEAHHFKNSETIGRHVLGELADSANQLLLLTATPLQTRSDNLLSLLRLLDYREFQNKTLFHQRLDTNRHIVSAERALRRSALDGPSMAAALAEAERSLRDIPDDQRRLFGLEGASGFDGLTERITSCLTEPSVERVMDIAEELREINLLAPYVTRTRKVDVQQTCKRHVESVRPERLTAAEEQFYEVTVEWFRDEVEERHGEQSVLFLSRTFERRLSSSLHGFAAYLLRGGPAADSILATPPEHVLDAARALGRGDTKFDALRRLLDGIRRDHPDEKVIIFASFRHTIRYLAHRLNQAGWQHEVIHGGIPMAPGDEHRDERGRRVKRFLSDPDCKLLLSSNVGGEGLDLQRASIVVNYDLPWNPATLEQRIGRVDRYGQEAEIVRILNFVLPGTVEDVIYTRVLHRLHMFEEAIGDFAEILGEILGELSLAFLRDRLTPAELEEQAREAALRVEQNRQHLDSVLEREGELVAYDEEFADQLRTLERRGQTIRPEDLRRLVDGILQQRFPGSWIRPSDGRDGVFDLYVDPGLMDQLKRYHSTSDSGAIWSLIHAVNLREVVQVTFDGQVAESEGDVVLLTSRHPVLQMLVRDETDPADFHSVAAVRLPPQDALASEDGMLALIDASFVIGPQHRRYLMPVWIAEGQIARSEHSREMLRAILDTGEATVPARAPSGPELETLLARAQDAAYEELDRTVDRIVRLEEARIRPRVEELRERYDRRIARSRIRLRDLDMEAGDTPQELERLERKRKSARDYLRRLTREKTVKIKQLEQLPEPESRVEAVGATWVEFG